MNLKLAQYKKSYEIKLEVSTRKLQQMLDMNTNKNVLSRATFADAASMKKMTAVSSEHRGITATSGGQNDPEREKLEF